MTQNKRTPKSISQKLEDLDAHLFIVREHLNQLTESSSHLKVLSAELRTLVCWSSGTEGLLWRLVDEFSIDDKIFLHVPGDLIEDHPLAQGLQFLIVPIQRGGKGDPHLPPVHYSLKEIIKETQALIAGGKPFTHSYLIKAVSQQMGSAHEDEGLEEMLVNLKSIFINGVEPFVSVLATDAKLTLEVGERVLEKAEKKHNYNRHHHKREDGNLSIVVSLRIIKKVLGNIPLFIFQSDIGDIVISVSATPTGVKFSIKKHNIAVNELVAKYPDRFCEDEHMVFIFSYCSRTKQARTIVNGLASGLTSINDIGWMHVNDFSLDSTNNDYSDFIEQFYMFAYERLLSSKDSSDFSDLPPDGYGLWRYSDELDEEGAFPE